MKYLLNKAIAAATAIAVAAGCSSDPKWSITGTMQGAGNGTIVLEAANSEGFWYPLDTLSISADGSFATERQALNIADIYRLNYGGRYIYFPVDSTDNLTIRANASAFDSDYELTGSPNADMISHVDHRINEFLGRHQVEDLDSAETLKRELSGMILQNPSGIVSYYIVQKQVKGRPLFRRENRRELGVIGAVANAYVENKPDDPRTPFLKNMWLQNMPRSLSGDTIVANEVDLIEISGLDNKGIRQSLTETAAKNKVVLLCFAGYSDSYSQPLDIALRRLWDKYHASGFEIFHLGFDANEFKWRVSADKQPWVTVFNGDTDRNITNYNVGRLPAIFIIRNGQLDRRVTDIAGLESVVASYF